MNKKLITTLLIAIMVTLALFGCGKDDKKEETKNNPEDNAVLYDLKAGEVGDYGSVINQDNKDYIYYTLPEGRYSVDWMGPEDVKNGMLEIGTKGPDNVFEELTRVDYDVAKKQEMLKEVDIKKGEVIRLSDLSYFRLTPMK